MSMSMPSMVFVQHFAYMLMSISNECVKEKRLQTFSGMLNIQINGKFHFIVRSYDPNKMLPFPLFTDNKKKFIRHRFLFALSLK